MSRVNRAVWRAHQAVQDLGLSTAVLELPGGYLIALISVIHRHWPHASGSETKDH